MATILSRKIYILLAVIGVTLIVIGIVLWFLNKRPSISRRETVVDFIEDARGLGYSGQRKIVTDLKGNSYIAYRKNHNEYAEIFVARINPSGNTIRVEGTTRPISAVGGKTDQRVPSVVIDKEETLHVVWYGSDSEKQENNRQIKYSQSRDQGVSWSQWKNISIVEGFKKKEDYWQEHPMILAGRDGALYVVWEGKDKKNKEQQVKFSRSNDRGVTWSQWKNARMTPDNTQSRPTLVEDSAGRLFLFIYSSSGNNNGAQQIRYSTSSDRGETWSEWETISDGNVDSRHVSAVMDDRGIIHAAWRSAIPSREGSQIMYRAFQNGSWSPERAVYSSSGEFQFFPSIGAYQGTIPYVVWMESDSSSDFPREDPRNGEARVSFLRDGVFTKPETFSESTGLYPHVPDRVTGGASIPVVYLSQNKNANPEKFSLVFRYIAAGI